MAPFLLALLILTGCVSAAPAIHGFIVTLKVRVYARGLRVQRVFTPCPAKQKPRYRCQITGNQSSRNRSPCAISWPGNGGDVGPGRS